MRHSHAAIALALLLPTIALAQFQGPPDPRLAGRRIGLVDGHGRGLGDGSDLGRAQVLVRTYVDAYDRALASSTRSEGDPWEVEAEQDGERLGRSTGDAEGRSVGRELGADAAAKAYAALQGRPAPRVDEPPPQGPRAAPDFEACVAREDDVRLAVRGRTITLDRERLDRGESSFDTRVPEPTYPSTEWMREKARDEGWIAGEDVDEWVDGYRDGFEESWTDAFEDERETIAWTTRRDYESDGEAEGRRVGQRRSACRAFRRGHQRGFDDGFDDGYRHGFRDAWASVAARHDAGPVIVVESARLVDGSGDDVFEPGEPIVLELSLANAGMRDAESAVLEWSGVQSLEASGTIEPAIAAQTRTRHVLELGPSDAGAPIEASIVVDLVPLNGETHATHARILRPARIETTAAFLEAQDGKLVTVVHATVRAVSRKRVDRALRITSGDAAADVGPIEPGEARDVAVLLPAAGSDLDGARTGDLRLVADGDRFWMQARFEATTGMRRAVQLVTRLPSGPTRDDAERAIAARLGRELDTALADPRLYKRLGDDSELSLFGAELRALGTQAAQPLAESVGRPLLARAEAKGTPRAVRKAVRTALGAR